MYNNFRGLSAFLVLMMALSSQAQIVINEVDADQTGTDAQEFVELFGPPNTALDGMVLVFFNGSNDESYNAVDLDGQTTDANGFFVYGSMSVPNVDLDAGAVTNLIQNGADAVALYTGDDTDFPGGTAPTAANIIDALVYGTNDPDDAGLLILTPGQPQINEDCGIDKDIESNSRSPDGGAALVTSTYVQQTPTPGVSNNPPPAANISIDDVTQAEGNAGTTTFDFTVSIDVAANATVQVDTADSSATIADSDYVAIAAQTVTFTAAGVTTQIVSVTINGDTTVESDETFNVNLTNVMGATIADNQGVGTITNDDVLAVVATAVVDNNVSINGGSDGQATASGTGGTPAYTFLWDDTAGQTTATATGLVAGTYTVTVTDSTTTNSDTAMVTITEPMVLTSTATVTDETSPGANDGTATVVASGGVGPYTYLWMPGGATTATITGLMPGTYTVVVTDANFVTASPVGSIVVVAGTPPAIIPTLNQYMIMLLMLLVGLVAVKRVRVKA
ncbi:MAG: hypothetical protein L3J83_00035 [Proteobacteria bacterium]|nr:hypothetical protein [Pseudomonadota bacterium]